jgi:3-hydroxyisobutyrate dehydrogenase-like beta-hydroxyacid dehydrogenase
MDLAVGFIGLGSQGLGMAQRIERAGHPLWVWARRRETLEPFAGTRARVASSKRELGAASDLLCICVVDDADVEQVLLGADGALAGMQRGSLIAIHSTIHPDTCARLAETARARGVGLLDAPVSGGGQVALEGHLKVMVGGDAADLARARPVFESYADRIVHLGSVGAGQICKLINNALMTAQLKLARDARSVAAGLGLDARALLDVVALSSGSSFALQTYAGMPSLVEGEDGRAARGAMANLIKDERILADLARAHAIDTADLGRTARAGARLLAE